MDRMNSDSSTDRPADRPGSRSRRLVGGLTSAMLLSLLLMLSPLPFSVFAAVPALIALVLLIVLIVRALKEKRFSTVIFSAMLGVPATLMVIGISVLTGAFYGPAAELQECQSTAITVQARAACTEAAEGSMAEWVNGIVGG